MKLKFLGTRGGVPVSGTHKSYGNSTSCVGIEIDGVSYIFDAGNGILNFENDHKKSVGSEEIRLFLTHYHFDHLIGFPFFQPLFMKEFDVKVYLPNFENFTGFEALQKLISPPLFPIDLSILGENVTFIEFEPGEEIIKENGFSIKTKLFPHPGGVCGYKLNYGAKSVVYLPDVENVGNDTIKNLVEFCGTSEILIVDATYSDQEIQTRRGWGHLCMSDLYQLAEVLQQTTIYLFHHEPNKTDSCVERDSAQLRSKYNNVFIARQGDQFEI